MKTRKLSQKLILNLIITTIALIVAVFLASYIFRNTKELMELLIFFTGNFKWIATIIVLLFISAIFFSQTTFNQELRQNREYLWLENLFEFNLSIERSKKEENSEQYILNSLGEMITTLTSLKKVSIHIYDESKEKLLWAYDKKLETKYKNEFTLILKDNMLYCYIQNEEVAILPYFQRPFFQFCTPSKFPDKKILLISLRDSEKNFGLIAVHDIFQEMVFEDRMNLLITHISTYAGLSIQNYFLTEKVQEVQIFDAVTGAFKYKYFYRFLDQEIERSDRFQKNTTLLVMEIDELDRFNIQPENPVYKHIHEEVLKHVRSIDLIFKDHTSNRISVILSETDSESGFQISERIIASIEKNKYKIDGIEQDQNIILSIGGSTYPDDTTLKANLVDNALQALDKARTNKSHICMFKNLYE